MFHSVSHFQCSFWITCQVLVSGQCCLHRTNQKVFISERISVRVELFLHYILGFPGDSDSKETARKRPGFHPWVRKIPWSREWQPAPVFLPGEFHGQRSLAGHSPWGHKELDRTERLTLSLPILIKLTSKAICNLSIPCTEVLK